MKIKTFITSGLALFLFLFMPASFHLNANANANVNTNAKFSITDVEYLKGEDFIQLHFIANDIIPIPDLFYPHEDDSTLIIMRITDVDFKVAKNNFKFQSPVIDNVKITKNGKFVDVKIKLKEKVNYRVFTNREGLYIEFPNVTTSRPYTETMSKKTPLAQKGESKKREVIPTPPVSAPAVEIEKKIAAEMSAGKNVILKNYKLAEKDQHSVKFEFALSGPVDYNVIPIIETPVRLAIDLKNTRAKRISEEINFLNVKGIRGALNSPHVYRVVFDLMYLKNYNVSFMNNNNVLVVEFFNQLPNKPYEKVLKAKTEADKNTILAKNQKGKEANTVKLKPQNDMGTEVIPEKTPVESSNDFFTDEKSEVTNATLKRDDFYDQENDQEVGEEGQISFLRRTIAGGEPKYSGEPYDFNFKGADLENVLLFFAKISGLSIVIDPGVSGTVTARMYQIPWDQALKHFLKVNGLTMVLEGNLLRIGRIDRIASEAKAAKEFKESRQMEVELETFTATLSFSKVSEVAPILKKRLSQRGEILEDNRTNTMIISEIPENIALLKKIIDTLDVANPQVSIEARIVETDSSYSKSLGIEWGYNFFADSMHGNQTSLRFPNSIKVLGNTLGEGEGPLGGYAVNMPASAPNTKTVFSLANVANTFRLDVALSAMEDKGKGRIISAPKTTTQNNVEARLMQGRQIPVQTLQNNTISVRYVPAALELNVTPQITARGDIICQIAIRNNSADWANEIENVGVPIITQSLDTTIMVSDGGTIVIGGLYRIEDSESSSSTPFFSKIPLIGNLFKNKTNRRTQKETLVFITPRIIR
jgi:type IV pilus assembly protein PilQ